MKLKKSLFLNTTLCTLMLMGCGADGHANTTSERKPSVDPNPVTKPTKSAVALITWKPLESYPFVFSFPVTNKDDLQSIAVLKDSSGERTQHLVNKYFYMLDGSSVRSFMFAILDYDNMNCQKSEEYLYETASSYNGKIEQAQSKDAKKELKYVIGTVKYVNDIGNVLKGYIKLKNENKCFAIELSQMASNKDQFHSIDFNEKSVFGDIVRKLVFSIEAKNND